MRKGEMSLGLMRRLIGDTPVIALVRLVAERVLAYSSIQSK
jgi:hypothetical protein